MNGALGLFVEVRESIRRIFCLAMPYPLLWTETTTHQQWLVDSSRTYSLHGPLLFFFLTPLFQD
jgi:hypothetical protein